MTDQVEIERLRRYPLGTSGLELLDLFDRGFVLVEKLEEFAFASPRVMKAWRDPAPFWMPRVEAVLNSLQERDYITDFGFISTHSRSAWEKGVVEECKLNGMKGNEINQVISNSRMFSHIYSLNKAGKLALEADRDKLVPKTGRRYLASKIRSLEGTPGNGVANIYVIRKETNQRFYVNVNSKIKDLEDGACAVEPDCIEHSDSYGYYFKKEAVFAADITAEQFLALKAQTYAYSEQTNKINAQAEAKIKQIKEAAAQLVIGVEENMQQALLSLLEKDRADDAVRLDDEDLLAKLG